METYLVIFSRTLFTFYFRGMDPQKFICMKFVNTLKIVSSLKNLGFSSRSGEKPRKRVNQMFLVLIAIHSLKNHVKDQPTYYRGLVNYLMAINTK